jgi:hypothetical protein
MGTDQSLSGRTGSADSRSKLSIDDDPPARFFHTVKG